MDLGRKRISVCFFRGSFRKSSRWSTWEGVFSAQLTLQARASSKSHEETLSATFWAEVSLSRVICPVGTRTLLLAPRPTSHIALSAKTPPPHLFATLEGTEHVASLTAGGHTKC